MSTSKMTSLTSSSIVSRRSNAVAREVGDGATVLLDLDDGVYYRIDTVGTAVWASLDTRPLTIEQIAYAIITDHEVETDDCRRDVLAFIGEMVAAGLVEVSDGKPQ
jgi:hypothetical protein